ncbi:MAG: rhodanese-like domain-containing protein [Candidatus Sericytochromatia bacterium]
MNFGYKGIANYYRLRIDEAFEMFKLNRKDIVFIDIRKEDKWQEGVIPNAKRINFDNLENEISSFDKNFHYILVCNCGNKSSLAANLMFKEGFEHIYSLEGGMLEWNSQKFEVSKN